MIICGATAVAISNTSEVPAAVTIDGPIGVVLIGRNSDPTG